MRSWISAAIVALVMAGAMPADAQTPPQQGTEQLNAAANELPRVFAGQVRVADLAASGRFYTETFGARVVSVHARESAVQFPSGPMIILVQGAAREAGAALADGAGGLLVQVGDIEATVGRVAAAGGSVVRPPNSGTEQLSYGVRAALIRDPDGVRIEVIQRPSAPPR